MLFPVCVHSDDDSVSMTIPDFPGCFSAADRWEEVPHMVQEAIELYCEGENFALPAPSTVDAFIGDSRFTDGVWMMVDVDVSKLDTKPVRLNVSLPRGLVEQIDRAAREARKTRSGFLADAARRVLGH